MGAVRAEALSSPYLNWIGDWPARLAGLVTVGLLLVGRLRRREDIANTEAPRRSSESWITAGEERSNEASTF
ncbi:MAG: hypothetical protein R3B96_03405 [Pirellulaceae bacterium]